MTDTERLAALLAQCQSTYVDANGDVRDDDDYYGEFAARLIAAGVTPAPTPPDALREAAQALVMATDNLAHWDHEHGYTCGECGWGRADQPRSLVDYVAHVNAEHPAGPHRDFGGEP